METSAITSDASSQENKKYRRSATSCKAIKACIRAHRYAFNKEFAKADLDDDEPDFEANRAGKAAYLQTMPPLVGLQNISDCLACVAYAQLIHILDPDEASEFRSTARIALAALRFQPKLALEPSAKTSTRPAGKEKMLFPPQEAQNRL